MITEAVAALVGVVFAFGAWCIRVELRLNKERQALVALEAAFKDLRQDVQRSSESLRHHGEMLAAIKATVDLMAAALRDMSHRLERLGDRTL